MLLPWQLRTKPFLPRPRRSYLCPHTRLRYYAEALQRYKVRLQKARRALQRLQPASGRPAPPW